MKVSVAAKPALVTVAVTALFAFGK